MDTLLKDGFFPVIDLISAIFLLNFFSWKLQDMVRTGKKLTCWKGV